MNACILEIVSVGIYSDQFANAAALAAAVQTENEVRRPAVLCAASEPVTASAGLMEAISGLDAVSQYAFRALHEAWHNTIAEPLRNAGDRTALLLFSTWGAIDNTIGFLDSMLDTDGRYASPRLFTRSVYSTVASHAAIHFGIHGPCETLAHGQWPVNCVLDRAADLLAAERVDYVIACWADQPSVIAKDLCRRGVAGLSRRELMRFTGDQTGYGAAAVILKRVEHKAGLVLRTESTVDHNPSTGPETSAVKLNIHPFPTDGAIHFVASILAAQLSQKCEPVYYTESSTHGRVCTQIQYH